MTLSHQLVTLNASTATIITVPASQEQAYSQSLTISIQNTGSVNVYLGDSTVTSSSYGYILGPGAAFSADLAPTDEIYAIADSGTPNVATIKVQH
jgi:hypothetical protein